MNAAIINDINYCKLVTPVQLLKTQADHTQAPVALTATPTHFRQATILGCKAKDGTANAGNVAIGASAAAGEQPFVIAPGDEITLPAPTGAKYNFQDWFLTVLNNGDGVVIIYS